MEQKWKKQWQEQQDKSIQISKSAFKLHFRRRI